MWSVPFNLQQLSSSHTNYPSLSIPITNYQSLYTNYIYLFTTFLSVPITYQSFARVETEADCDVERPLQPGRPLELLGGWDGLQRGQVWPRQSLNLE